MMTELGQFVEAALSITSWIAGMFSFGGKPLTGAGKKLAELAKRRGIEGRAADGWAREYEKVRDKECKGPAAGQPDTREACWAGQVERMVSQLSPPVTLSEFEELRQALSGGGFNLPGYPGSSTGGGVKWLPSHLRVLPLPGGPSINLPGFPGGPAGGGGGVLQAGMGGGTAGLLLIGAGLLFALSKPGSRRR
jgi:hypothetical protein